MSLFISCIAIISFFLSLFASKLYRILFAATWLSLLCGSRMRDTVYSNIRDGMDEFYMVVLFIIAIVGFYGGLVGDSSWFMLLLLDGVLGIYIAILYNTGKN